MTEGAAAKVTTGANKQPWATVTYMAQRFGAVFAIAIGIAVFTSQGSFASPETITAGFKPAMWALVFAVSAAVAATAMAPRPTPAAEEVETPVAV
jgi:hypothetical protein